jgi:hypothetical protein
MLLEDLKLNIRTARARRAAVSEGTADRQVTTGRQSSGFRAWRAGRPFTGAVLTMIAGIELFFSGQLDLGNIHVSVGIAGLQSTVIPVIMVTLGILTIFMPQHRIFYGVISLVVSVYSLIGLNLGGFFIGMILGAVGGILAVSWMPKKAVLDGSYDGSHDDLRDEPADEHAPGPRPLVGSRH